MALTMNYNQNLQFFCMTYFHDSLFFPLLVFGKMWMIQRKVEEELSAHRCNFKPILILKETNLSGILNVKQTFFWCRFLLQASNVNMRKLSKNYISFRQRQIEETSPVSGKVNCSSQFLALLHLSGFFKAT